MSRILLRFNYLLDFLADRANISQSAKVMPTAGAPPPMITQLESEVEKLKQGDHVCPVYESMAQQTAVAAPFIKKGIENGERVFYGADDRFLKRMSEALTDVQVDVEREIERGALNLVSAQGAYLRGGKFHSEAMIGFLYHSEMAALAAGFSGSRFIGDMSWVLGAHFDPDLLVEYEAMLNSFVAGSRSVLLCQYDRTRFDPALIHDILRVHPIAILGDFVCQNPYCEPPELLLRREHMAQDEYKRKRVDWWITRLKAVAKMEQERVRAEEALAEAEHKYHTLFDVGINGGFLIHEGVLIDCNRKVVEMFGVPRDQIIGHRLEEFSAPVQPDGRSSRDIAWEKIQSALAGEPQFFEWTVLRPDRKRLDCEIGLKSFELTGKGYVHGIASDITERKQAREQAERVQRQMESLLDSAGEGICGVDMQGRCTFINRAAAEMLGYDPKETLGRNIHLLIHHHRPDGSVYPFEECPIFHSFQRNERCRVDDEVFWRADGVSFPVEYSSCPIIENGAVTGGVVTFADTTERKNMEAQMMRSRRMESIGALAGGVAHDLNNILTPILMSIAVLRFTATDSKSQRILEKIELSSKRGADIVRQVLSFARGVEGVRVEVQPKHLFEDIKAIIKDTFPKNIRLEVPATNGVWTILGDATQLLQVLLNLCVNARDAMPLGGSLVLTAENTVLDSQYASMHADAKPGPYVTISVTDSGTGISPDIIESIFEPFFTTKQAENGTGLGLSTVMAIVKGHDGFITVSSEPGQGTSFRVCLPAARGVSESRKEILREAAPRGNGETILIVDDEASILAITSQTLEAFGYQTLTANDGVEAVTIYARRREDIAAVLTDISMPIMDGATTIRVLMKMNPAVKIIAASGVNAEGSSVARDFEAIVKKFLAKPYTAETLLTALRKVLDED